MGSKRVGLARTQALIENLKRELQMNGATIVGNMRKTISLTGADATQTLTADDNGAIIFMGGSNASEVTLPAVQDGLWFEVYMTTAHEHIVKAKTNVMQGNYRHNSNSTTMTRVAISNKGKLTINSSHAKIGDRLQFWCDGTNWHVDGITNNVLVLGTV